MTSEARVSPKKVLFAVFGIAIILIVGAIVYINLLDLDNKNKSNLNVQSVERNMNDFSVLHELTQDTQAVSFYDVEDKIEFLKAEGGIYLVPKKASSIEVYKTGSGKNIIKIQ